MSMKAAISELAAATLLAAGDAAAQSRTTTPGVVYVLTVLLMDTSILATPDMVRPQRTIRYPRGAPIRYALATRAHDRTRSAFWGAGTAVVKPGGHGAILVNWNYRGLCIREHLPRLSIVIV